MKQILIIFLLFGVCACAPKKPPLDETQLIGGKSIIIPPEFDVRP
ncbi:MAG: hypothetical protein ACI4QM_00895 [Alphaproteobacteria bacterium]